MCKTDSLLPFSLETSDGPRSKNSKFHKCSIKHFFTFFGDKDIRVTSVSHIYVCILFICQNRGFISILSKYVLHIVYSCDCFFVKL